MLIVNKLGNSGKRIGGHHPRKANLLIGLLDSLNLIEISNQMIPHSIAPMPRLLRFIMDIIRLLTKMHTCLCY